MRQAFASAATLALLCTLTVLAHAEETTCQVTELGLLVRTGDTANTYPVDVPARNCIAVNGRIYVAAGAEGVITYTVSQEGMLRASTWRPAEGDVLHLEQTSQGLVAVMGRLDMVPLTVATDGSLRPVGLAAFVGDEVREMAPTVTTAVAPPGGVAETPKPEAAKEVAFTAGRVLDVRAEVAVINLGSDDGVEVGDRFELRSQALKSQYSLATEKDEMLPSNEVTGVVKVTSVAPDKCLVSLGRGDRTEVGDLALPTLRNLTGDNWFPGYERNLNRVQAKIGPFLGIDTLSAGMMASVTYDHTFSFPLRIQAGLDNVGFVFGEDFAAPLHTTVLPSYDTDYFEVGLGLGYAYSNHDRRRGLLFVQKVRLGTVDGVSLTAYNSFVYQKARPGWSSFDSGGAYAPSVGDSCTPGYDDEEWTGHEFNWEGIDLALNIPITSRVALISNFSYANAGYVFGDLGIKTLVMGNGGHGTLAIPVTIGGVLITDYVGTGSELYCDADDNEYKRYNHYESNDYGGPVVTIGIDYRWR